jgi:hypothetical protein
MPGGRIADPDRWRSGFYHIARGADVPIFLIAFDWGRRTMRLGPLLRVRPDAPVEDELARIKGHFAGVRGRRWPGPEPVDWLRATTGVPDAR